MDLTFFVQNKHLIEGAEKQGLYCIEQKLPKESRALRAFRCGLAGKPQDSAYSAYRSTEGNFASRFANYLNYWLPTDGIVHAILTVPRVKIAGFSERVMTPREPGDNREDYAREGTSIIQIREKQYHNLLMSGIDKLQRLSMPGTDESKKRSEFFRGDLQKCIRSLKAIGTGDLYLFESNSKVKKITLRRRGIADIKPDQIKLRRGIDVTANSEIIKKLSNNDAKVTKALLKLTFVTPKIKPVLNPPPIRRSPRFQNCLQCLSPLFQNKV